MYFNSPQAYYIILYAGTINRIFLYNYLYFPQSNLSIGILNYIDSYLIDKIKLESPDMVITENLSCKENYYQPITPKGCPL